MQDTLAPKMPVIGFSQGMKKLLQIVAVCIVSLLASEPALTGLACSMNAPSATSCASNCAMAMNQMGMDCQTHSQAAGTGCAQDCCQHSLPQSVASLTVGARLKTFGTHFTMMAHPIVPPVNEAFAAPPPGAFAASSPDRQVLFQVFRI